jgi:hypothetical protein
VKDGRIEAGDDIAKGHEIPHQANGFGTAGGARQVVHHIGTGPEQSANNVEHTMIVSALEKIVSGQDGFRVLNWRLGQARHEPFAGIFRLRFPG